MLATKTLPTHAAVFLLALTLGCNPPPMDPSDSSAIPPTESAAACCPPIFEPPDACATFQGSRFRSASFQELGPRPHGIPTLGRWQLTFEGGQFERVSGRQTESGTYVCADLNLAGLTSNGRQISGTYDLFTALLTWDGVVYLNESDAANLDICAAIDGNTFHGLEASALGNAPSPEDITFGRASISFELGEFHWSHSDVIETGAYTCVEGRFTATRSDGSEMLAAFDPLTGILTWGSAAYGDSREFPDADP